MAKLCEVGANRNNDKRLLLPTARWETSKKYCRTIWLNDKEIKILLKKDFCLRTITRCAGNERKKQFQTGAMETIVYEKTKLVYLIILIQIKCVFSSKRTRCVAQNYSIQVRIKLTTRYSWIKNFYDENDQEKHLSDAWLANYHKRYWP